MTFYFGDKAEPAIISSAVPDELKKQIKEGKRFGKIRGLTIVFDEKKKIAPAIALIALKLMLKWAPMVSGADLAKVLMYE